MSLSVLTPPAAPALSSSDAVVRQHLRLGDDETDHDALVDDICKSAEQIVETYTRRYLMTQTLRLTRDGFSCRRIDLPCAPIQSIAEISYLDGSGAWVSMDAAEYRLLDGGAVCPAYGAQWPVPRLDFETVRIDVVVGYGVAKDAVPPQLLGALRFLIAHLYLNDAPVVIGQSVDDLPFGVRELLDPWRFWL